MANTYKTSTFKIIVVGYLMVNIPLMLIIFGVAFLLSSGLGLTYILAVLMGASLGMAFRRYATAAWIKWALKKNVTPGRLYNISIWSLLLWHDDLARIEKIAAKLGERS